MMDSRMRASLDRWITGNYGEDQFRDEEEEIECEPDIEDEIPDYVWEWLEQPIEDGDLQTISNNL